MAESETYRRGREIRRQLLGDTFVEQMDRTTYADPTMRKFIDLVTETAFGTLWTRPGLDLKTRTLVCVISDAATGREPELAIHLRMALRQGWTQEELTEVLLHMSAYVGLPIKPAIVQKRCFASQGWDRAVRKFCNERGIPYQAFSLLTANPEVLRNRRVNEIASRTGKTTPQVVFRFALQVGMIALTGTASVEHMADDLGVHDFELEADDVRAMEELVA